MSKVFLRTEFNYDMFAASRESGLACCDDSLTIQSAAEDADINTIVRRFGLTGELPGDVDMPQSGDYTGIGDFHSAMEIVRRAEEQFMKVPADIRARFNHDPGLFSEFFNDEKNFDEAFKMGLVNARPIPPLEVPDPSKS